MFSVIVLGLLSSVSWAQFEKGTKSLGGVFSIYGDKSKSETSSGTDIEQKSTTVNIEPSFGIFITPRTSVGISMGYSSSISEYSDSRYSEGAFSIGSLLRHHFPLSEAFSLYIQEGVKLSFGNEKDEGDSFTSEHSTTDFLIGLSPGIIYFPSSKFGLEAGVGSLYYLTHARKDKDDDSKTTDNSYGLNFSMSAFYFGLRYYF